MLASWSSRVFSRSRFSISCRCPRSFASAVTARPSLSLANLLAAVSRKSATLVEMIPPTRHSAIAPTAAKATRFRRTSFRQTIDGAGRPNLHGFVGEMPQEILRERAAALPYLCSRSFSSARNAVQSRSPRSLRLRFVASPPRKVEDWRTASVIGVSRLLGRTGSASRTVSQHFVQGQFPQCRERQRRITGQQFVEESRQACRYRCVYPDRPSLLPALDSYAAAYPITTAPACVWSVLAFSTASADTPSALAMPISISFGTGLPSTSATKILEGFKSRCSIAFWWA